MCTHVCVCVYVRVPVLETTDLTKGESEGSGREILLRCVQCFETDILMNKTQGHV